MKQLLQILATFLLLAVPAFASVQMSGSEKAALDALNQAQTTLEQADGALAEASDDAAAIKAQETATTAYASALDSAREIRDTSSEGNSGDFGQAIYGVSGQPEDASGAALAGKATDLVAQAKTWVMEEGPGMALNAILFLVILAVFKLLAKIAAGIVSKALGTSKLNVSDLLKKFFIGMVQKLVFFVGVLTALEFVGVDTGPLLAGVGVVGFVIGFALQDTLSNFASGVMILLYRPYDIGDVISAAGETGSVKDMSLVSTTLGTPDNQKLIIPNSAIWGGTIRNITAQDTRRVDMVVGVSYSDDLDKAQEVLLEVVSSHPLVLKDPAPVVMVNNLGDSAVEFVVRPWSKTSDYWAVYWDLTKTIKQRLDQEGISFPFPQSDVHIVEMPQTVGS